MALRVGFLQTRFSAVGPGGGELHTEHLARALENRGHEVVVFTDAPKKRRDGIDDLTVREYSTPAKLNPINELALARVARDDVNDCDVLTLTDDSAYLGVNFSVPTVMVFHLVWHGWVDRHRPLTEVVRSKPQAFLYRWMERRICRESDAIVSISPNIRSDIELIGDFGDKIYDIPNGVDLNRFHPAKNRYETFTVHFQGRLVEMKNPDLLIEAVARSNQNWQLTIGGSGPMREELEHRVKEYEIGERVSFLGYVPEEELPERYAKSHVYVLPSTYEGMPLTVLEAAASGTATVVTPRSATDFVTDEMGVVVPPDPDHIASTLDALSVDPERVERMGKQARERAKEYSWDRIAAEYETLYRSVVEP